jgi:branched-chain amino acid transport system permease protein
MRTRLRWAGAGLLLTVGLFVPVFIHDNYVLHILILSAMYVAFALSFDIAAGHVGAISLAHPVFFGLGAYTAAILGRSLNSPFWANMLISGILAITLSALMGLFAFRLADLSFAIATLGLALSAQLVSLNWVEVTGGPMCTRGVPRPSLLLGQDHAIYLTSQPAYFYLFLGLDIVVAVLYVLTTTGRLGRTLTAIRNDEVLASTVGIDVIRYKRVAFYLGAGIAGAVGSLWAQYITVVCPDYLGIAYTNTLLIIVFIGGAASFFGVTMGAIILTVVPEILRIAPEIRLILYGAILLIMVIAMPNGLAGAFSSLIRPKVDDPPGAGDRPDFSSPPVDPS